MGYTTDFEGQFKIDTALSPEQIAYLNAFSDTRRMSRNELVEKLSDPVREAAGLPIGTEGEYFVGGGGALGQERDDSVENHNGPASTQPGLWCQWVPTDDGLCIEWNEAEKFYRYTEWLEYIIENFMKPWGKTLSGRVRWSGEDMSDIGAIVITNNIVETVNFDLDYKQEPEDIERPKDGVYTAANGSGSIEIRDGIPYVISNVLIG